MPKCIIYVRVSDPSQVDGTSLDTQTEKCRTYAEREGFEVVRVFREEGVSAKVWNRPELVKALDFLKDNKGKVGFVVIYTIDRISRNLEDQFVILKALREAGTELRSVAENINATPAGQLIRNVLWAVAEFDNKVRAEKCYNGSKARFMQGYWTHTPPPGYRMVRDPITKRSLPTLIPELAPHIRWAFEKRAEGWAYDRIAQGMTQRGYRTRNGKRVTASQIERMTKHPFYMGLMRSYGEEIEGKHEPLVSKSLWYRVQGTTEENATANSERSPINPLFPLRHFVRCTDCDARLTASSPQGKTKKYPYYHHGSHKCETARNIPKAELEEQFRNKLRELKPKPEHFGIVRQAILDVWKDKIEKHTTEQSGLHGRITAIRNEKATLLELKRQNPLLYTDEEFLQQKQELNDQITHLELQLTDDKEIEHHFEEVVDRAFASLKNPVESWEELEIERKRKFQQLLFPEGLTFDGEKFGTPKYCLLLQLFEAASEGKSQVVDTLLPRWNSLVAEIQQFSLVFRTGLY